MPNSAAAAVLDCMESDEAFAQRVKDAGGPEASIEFLNGEGFEVTRSDMRDAALDRYGNQLTTEQVDALAGGLSDGETVLVGALGGWVAVGVVGAAAAAAV